MTPSGYFPLLMVFGYKKDIPTKMNYLVVNKNHVWVCDASDDQYNKIVEDSNDQYRNNPKNERLFRPDHLNKYAIVIGYNTNPIKKGNGSAIFMHVERTAYHKTAGCISMPEEKIVELIKWLNPSMMPHIYISR